MSYKIAESYNMSTVTLQMISEENNSDKAVDAAEEVKEYLKYIEKKMSFYLKDSDVSKINNSSGKEYVKICRETMEVIKYSIEYAKLTNMEFDITLGPVINEWGIFSEHEKVPCSGTINELLKLTGIDKILIKEDEKSVKLKEYGQKIDLGGIAKGYAADKAIDIYKKNDVKSALINIGGNVSVLGRKQNNDMWTVGIQNPYMDRGQIVAAVKCEDTSVVTSGNYVRYFAQDDKKYGHIIRHDAGIPVRNEIASVTIICSEAVKADALSTALFAMGKGKAIDFCRKTDDFSAVLITEDKEIFISRNTIDKFILVDDSEYKIYVI